MGKNKSGNNDEGGASKAFVLKVATHCHCEGCTDKIRAAVKDLTRHEGIQSWDQSALDSKGELKLLATADPEKLRHRLHKATRKNVDLIFPTKPATDKNNKDNNKAAKDAAATALLLNALQQGQYAGNQLLAGGGYGGGYGVPPYPWGAAQQPDPYAGAYPAAGGAWGGYPYPPAAQHGYGGAYGGAWHGGGY